MDIENIVILPKVISSSTDLAEEFNELFCLEEAQNAKGVVYFFMSKNPIPRVNKSSKILYIGKTKQSLKQRYLRYSGKLASGRSGDFFRHIIQNYGGISLGYLLTPTPRETEAKYFKKYYELHLEFPPKSKVG